MNLKPLRSISGAITKKEATMATDETQHDHDAQDDMLPQDLSHAGAVVDQAIAFMTDKQLNSLSIASALLSGSLSMLGRSLDDASVIAVLENAIASVRSGELKRLREAAATSSGRA
ncbi:Hypothetical protein GbCGDNIH9_0613 [Granulibacter bethesdensis]|uniref:Uncharacterized protein n=2 Tax=Granulibacter bethesdensis TaxID=364410 RepID=A0AAC9P7T3_9PROT|nr:Hypothetical protein GbCGDNIH9_0613 [Granulibacter bethesdensis]APH61434.1 Hypothetical protein GbCGDNIH8_0613 [Granulibacter bethesdensis]